jgi:transcriptional regulator with XRE-family HTH domain
MSDVRVGYVVRSVRLHRGLTQQAVENLSGIDRSALSKLERGHLELVSLRSARRLCAALEIELAVDARWRGGAVDRLLDRGHAAIVEYVASVLSGVGWTVVPEYTFNEFGDRGSVDVLGWHPEHRALLLVEVKTSITDLQAMLMSMSKKVRVVPTVVERERNWRRAAFGRLLVVAGTTANRTVARRHKTVFATTFPDGAVAARAWVGRPVGDFAGLWFVSSAAVRNNHATPRSRPRPRRA